MEESEVDEKCDHVFHHTGVLECDLARNSGSTSRYCAQIEVNICEKCGAIELTARSHRLVCDWLEARRTTP